MSTSAPSTPVAKPARSAPATILLGAVGVAVALLLVMALMIATQTLVVSVLHAPQTAWAYLAGTLALALLYHFIGGRVGAAIARNATACWVLVILGAVLMAGSVRNTWAQVAPWYSAGMLIAAPLGLWLGARRQLQTRRASPSR